MQHTADASNATPESDAALSTEMNSLGAGARKRGIAREDCPYDGLLARWWTEGWDAQWAGPFIALMDRTR